MITSGINFKNFTKKNNTKKIKKILEKIIENKNQVLESLSNNYVYSFKKKNIKDLKKYTNFRIIGMGGSILGARAIYDFLKHKINKKFSFVDNLQDKQKKDKKFFLNLIVSKSGNTIETIVNANILIKKKDKNIFITENKNSYLTNLAKKLESEIVEHKNFIGGRYSVLSEVGMLPAELMGLNEKKFKQFNSLVKSKGFVNSLIANVSNTLELLKKGKFTSVILNYDESSNNFFKWYQQLIAESLGKNSKGILPVISTMPKDNHSLMQLYLDGPKNNFFTFFHVSEKKTFKINNNEILRSHNYLKNKKIEKIKFSQKIATENVFLRKKIPFRSFEVSNKTEKSLGELFCFFILETILLGKALNLNPYDQPAVELIKIETKKLLT